MDLRQFLSVFPLPINDCNELVKAENRWQCQKLQMQGARKLRIEAYI